MEEEFSKGIDINELKQLKNEINKLIDSYSIKQKSCRDIYQEFLNNTGIDKESIENYRPCTIAHGVPDIQNAIVIWLKGDGKMIYISED